MQVVRKDRVLDWIGRLEEVYRIVDRLPLSTREMAQQVGRALGEVRMLRVEIQAAAVDDVMIEGPS